jgi:hypothetical protein
MRYVSDAPDYQVQGLLPLEHPGAIAIVCALVLNARGMHFMFLPSAAAELGDTTTTTQIIPGLSRQVERSGVDRRNCPNRGSGKTQQQPTC